MDSVLVVQVLGTPRLWQVVVQSWFAGNRLFTTRLLGKDYPVCLAFQAGLHPHVVLVLHAPGDPPDSLAYAGWKAVTRFAYPEPEAQAEWPRKFDVVCDPDEPPSSATMYTLLTLLHAARIEHLVRRDRRASLNHQRHVSLLAATLTDAPPVAAWPRIDLDPCPKAPKPPKRGFLAWLGLA